MPPAARHLVIEKGESGKTAAEDDRVGINEVDDAGEGAGEAAGVTIERCPAVRIASGRGGGDLRRRGVVPGQGRAIMAAMVGGQPGARQKRLDAAGPAA